jgi:hypothetical protein
VDREDDAQGALASSAYSRNGQGRGSNRVVREAIPAGLRGAVALAGGRATRMGRDQAWLSSGAGTLLPVHDAALASLVR